jgi:hypothetical protein
MSSKSTKILLVNSVVEDSPVTSTGYPSSKVLLYPAASFNESNSSSSR